MTKRKKKEAEAEVVTPIDFKELLPTILAKVTDVTSIEAWRKAYPDVEFLDVDDGFTGRPIDWAERSPVEIAAYVAYWRDPQMAEIDYEILLDGYQVKVSITDSERAWWMWMTGCLVEGELSDTAQATLLHYAAQQAGDFEEMVEDRYLPDDLDLLHLEMRVKPFKSS